MHEFVMSLEDLKKKSGVSAMDIAKGLLDNGIHPPTMYFPLEKKLMYKKPQWKFRQQQFLAGYMNFQRGIFYSDFK